MKNLLFNKILCKSSYLVCFVRLVGPTIRKLHYQFFALILQLPFEWLWLGSLAIPKVSRALVAWVQEPQEEQELCLQFDPLSGGVGVLLPLSSIAFKMDIEKTNPVIVSVESHVKNQTQFSFLTWIPTENNLYVQIDIN